VPLVVLEILLLLLLYCYLHKGKHLTLLEITDVVLESRDRFLDLEVPQGQEVALGPDKKDERIFKTCIIVFKDWYNNYITLLLESSLITFHYIYAFID